MARKHLISLASIALVGIIAGGCVSQEKYNALKLDRDRYAEQLGQAQTESGSARAEADAYKNQLANLGNSGNSKEAMILNLSNQNADLQRQVDELKQKYADAAGKVGSPLPEALNTALLDFARQNPDIAEYDSARGIVKFKSDVTFAPGSAEVTPKAREAISRFAQILNSPAASGYELMVAGHTDNTNVVNPVTLNAGHKNNWYLSAHRAIAVGAVLMSQGVNGQRLAVTGYADERPIASNNSESGKAANRRVEVLILPTQIHSLPMASGPAPITTSKLKARHQELNKDSVAPPPTAKNENSSAFSK